MKKIKLIGIMLAVLLPLISVQYASAMHCCPKGCTNKTDKTGKKCPDGSPFGKDAPYGTYAKCRTRC